MEKSQSLSMSWSGGKDSALALWKLMQRDDIEVVELFTTVNDESQRVGLHGVPAALIEAQAMAIGLPLKLLEIPADATNDSFERVMRNYYETLVDRSIPFVGFGDIFLEDLKAYRDDMLEAFNLEGVYPLWQRSTKELPYEFLDAGFQSVICSANRQFFEEPIVGKRFDAAFLDKLPKDVDPNGENGEFHSFVVDGPYFSKQLTVTCRDRVVRHYEYEKSDGTMEKVDYEFADLQLA